VSITTFAGYIDQLTRLLDGESTGTSVVTPATVLQIISLGERRVYRELRTRWNEKAFADMVVTDNLAPIPDDYEAPSIVHFGDAALEPTTEEFCRENARLPHVAYFAQAGDSLTFAGTVGDGEEVQGRYFYRLPDLDATTLPTNDFFLNENAVFIYAALAEAAPFYGQDARIPLWEARYASIKEQLNTKAIRAAYSAGRLRMRPSARIERLPEFTSSPTADVLDGGTP
jgi:hypothetical protein